MKRLHCLLVISALSVPVCADDLITITSIYRSTFVSTIANGGDGNTAHTDSDTDFADTYATGPWVSNLQVTSTSIGGAVSTATAEAHQDSSMTTTGLPTAELKATSSGSISGSSWNSDGIEPPVVYNPSARPNSASRLQVHFTANANLYYEVTGTADYSLTGVPKAPSGFKSRVEMWGPDFGWNSSTPVQRGTILTGQEFYIEANGETFNTCRPPLNVVNATCFTTAQYNWSFKFKVSETPLPPDTDLDGTEDAIDNCPSIANSDQLNTDGVNDGGNACDEDDDNDNWQDVYDNCPVNKNANQADADGDSIGNVCDPDYVPPGCG